MSCHVFGLRDTEQVTERRCDIGEDAVSHGGVYFVLVVSGRWDIDARHGIERVGGIGRTVFVNGVVGIAVVGDDNNLIAILLCRANNRVHADVDGNDVDPVRW